MPVSFYTAGLHFFYVFKCVVCFYNVVGEAAWRRGTASYVVVAATIDFIF